MSNFPWFLPGVAISALVSIMISRFVAEKLAISRALGYALVVWLGVILAATMTPSIEGMNDPDRMMAWCDLSRIGPPPLDQLDTFNNVSLNVLLFVPLGVLVSAIGRHSWKTLMWAAALPFLIEGVQFFFGAPIGRECQSADMFDNLTGLLLGYVGGAADCRSRGVASSPQWRSPQAVTRHTALLDGAGRATPHDRFEALKRWLWHPLRAPWRPGQLRRGRSPAQADAAAGGGRETPGRRSGPPLRVPSAATG